MTQTPHPPLPPPPAGNRIEEEDKRNAALNSPAAFYYLTEFAQSKSADYYFHHGDNANRHGTIPSSHYYYQQSSSSFLHGIISFLKQGLYYTLCTLILWSTSLAWYSLIYVLIMPQQYATETIYFNYNSQESSCNQAIMNHYGVCPATAVIDLVSPNSQWKAHMPDVIHNNNDDDDDHDDENSQLRIENEKYTNDNKFDQDKGERPWYAKRFLVPKMSYFIQVGLTLPESTNNRDIGMFMVEMDLKSTSSQNKQSYNNVDFSTTTTTSSQVKLLASSSRPAMLPYQSTYVSLVKKSFIMFPLILGAIPEARTIIIECFDGFRESEKYPMNLVEVRLVLPHRPVSLDNNVWNHVQIWKAELRIGKELNRLQWLMREWFYSFAFMGIAFIMGLQVLFWFVCKLAWDRNRSHGHHDEHLDNQSTSSMSMMHDIKIIDDNDNDEDDIDVSTRKGRSNDIQSSVNSPFSMIHEEDEDDTSDSWEPFTNTSCAVDHQHVSVEQNCGKNKHQHAQVSNNQKEQSQSNIDVGQTNAGKNQKKKKSNKKKKKKLSNNKSELRMNIKSKQSEEEERLMAERVMRGDIEPFEIFTDLDEPE